MRKTLAVILMFLLFNPSARAQEGEWTVTHTLSNVSSDADTTTLDLLVAVTRNGPEAVEQIALVLPGPTGDDTAIEGRIAIDRLAAGQIESAAGVFIAPREFFEGAAFDILSWKLTYVDAQGETRTVMILGHRQP